MTNQNLAEKISTLEKELELNIEKLKSVNEALQQVNRKLNQKSEKLAGSGNSPPNVPETDIITIVVHKNLDILHFTANSTGIFDLDSRDNDQPFRHIAHQLDYDGLEFDVRQVISNHRKIEDIVESKDGKRYKLSIHPNYKNGNTVSGAVLNLTEIPDLLSGKQKTGRQTNHEEALVELGMNALREHDPHSTIEMALEKICTLLNVDHCLVLGIEDGEIEGTILGSTFGCGPEAEHRKIRIEPDWDVARALNSESPLLIEDYNRTDGFRQTTLLGDMNPASAVYMTIGSTRTTLGVLGAYSQKKRSFEEHELTFIKIISNMIGSVMERNRASTKLKVANRKLAEEIDRSKRYQKEILNVNIIERWNLGEYLHDNLSQTLASAKIMLDDIQKRLADREDGLPHDIDSVKHIIETGLQEVRNISHEIVPIDIEEEGILHAFKHVLKQTEKLYRVNCTLEVDAVTNRIKNRELATNLYRVAQEAIKNAVVHGRARHIKVVIIEHNKQLYLHIKNDGEGVQYEDIHRDDLSINIMKHRMEILGGTFRIQRLIDSGLYTTCVTCTLPMKALEAIRTP